MKKVKVNYPKKKPRIKLEDLEAVTEPERCSMYQVLQDNLKLFNRTTFLHRIIYVVAHKFPYGDDVKVAMQNIITKCNDTYCLEKLSGFLLYYPQYLVHMVEGDEDNINKHLGYLLDEKAPFHNYLGNMKLIIHVSNINQRFSAKWLSMTGAPSKLLEKLDINADLHQSGRNVYNCIKKMYTLISAYTETSSTAATTDSNRTKFEPELSASQEFVNRSMPLFNAISFASIGTESHHGDSCTQKELKIFLPEYELLDFVLYCSYTMNLKDYYALYGVVPMRDIYKDKVWPVAHDFIPYDIFEKPYCCVTDLSKTRRRTPSERTPTASATGSGTSTAEFLTPRGSSSALLAHDESGSADA